MNSLVKKIPADDGERFAPGSSVVDRVTRQIRKAILEGRMVPGQRLVENDLTEEFNVSRPTLRIALSRLAVEGLLLINAHRGATVRKMSRRDVRELYEIREHLEGLAAALAADQVAAGGDASALIALLPLLRPGVGRLHEGAEASALTNQRFHQVILEMSANSRLIAMLDQLNVSLFRLQFRGYLKPRIASQSATDHERIARAVLEGDSLRSGRVMRAHVRKSAAIILALPDEMFDV